MVSLAALLDREPLASRDVLAELDGFEIESEAWHAAVAAGAMSGASDVLEVQRSRWNLRRSFEAPTMFEAP